MESTAILIWIAVVTLFNLNYKALGNTIILVNRKGVAYGKSET